MHGAICQWRARCQPPTVVDGMPLLTQCTKPYCVKEKMNSCTSYYQLTSCA